jgi:alpha-tubulin suppressor-like RCC1 family protein
VSNNLYRVSWTPVPGLYRGDNYEIAINGETHIVNSAASSFVYRGSGDNKVIHQFGGPTQARFITSSGKIINSNGSAGFNDMSTINWTTTKAKIGYGNNVTSQFILDDNTLWEGTGTNSAPTQISTTELGSEVIVDVVGQRNAYTAIITASGKVKTRCSTSYAYMLGSGSSTVRTTFADVSGIDWTTKKAVAINTAYTTNILAITLNDGTVYLLGSNYSAAANNYLPYKLPDFDGITRKAVDFKVTDGVYNMFIALLDNGRIMTNGYSDLTLGRGKGAATTVFDYVSGVDGVTVKAKRIFTSDGQFNRWWAFTTESGGAYVVGNGMIIGNNGGDAYVPVPYPIQFPNNRVVEFSGSGVSTNGIRDEHVFAIFEDGSIYASGTNHSSIFGSGYVNGQVYDYPVLVKPSSVANTTIDPNNITNVTVATKRLATLKSTATTASLGIMPTNPVLTAIQASATSVTLNWTGDAGTYSIYRTGTVNAIATTNGMSYTVTNITPQDTYGFYVAISNQYGTITSNIASIFIPSVNTFNTYSSSPSSLIAGYDLSNNYYKIKWNAAAIPTNNTVYELAINGSSTKYLSSNFAEYEYLGEGSDRPIKIACGQHHTLVLMESGKVMGFGNNNYGQININNSAHIATPIVVPGIDWTTKKALNIAAGSLESAILLNDGTLAYIGFNAGSTVQYISLAPLNGINIVDIQLQQYYIALLLEDGTVWTAGTSNYYPQGTVTNDSLVELRRVRGIDWTTKNAVNISASLYMMFITMSDGTVFYTGENNSNILGLTSNTTANGIAVQINEIDGININVVKAVPVSRYAGYFLLNNGRILVAGRNDNGILGISNTDTYITKTVTSQTYLEGINGVGISATDIIMSNNGTDYQVLIKTQDNDYYGVGNVGYLTGAGNAINIIKVINASNTIMDVKLLNNGIIILYKDGTVVARGTSTNYSLGQLVANNTVVNSPVPGLTTAAVTPVDSSTSYTFSLKRLTFKTASAPISSNSVSTAGGILPAIPSNFTATQTIPKTATLSWSAQEDASGYVITTLSGQITTTATSIDISGLNDLQTYNYSINAINPYGTSYSASTSITIASDRPKVSAISISGDSVAVNWSQLTNADNYNLTIKQYTQQYPLATIASSANIRFGLDDRTLGTVGSTIGTWSSIVGSVTFGNVYSQYGTITLTMPTIVRDSVSGKKVVRFNGINDGLVMNNNVLGSENNNTILFVAKTNTTTCRRVIDDSFYNGTYYGWENNQTNVTGLNSSYAIPTDTNWRVFAIVIGSPCYFFIGGVKYNIGNPGDRFYRNRLSLGGRGGNTTGATGSGVGTNCDVAAVYYWNRQLSDAEILSYQYQLVQKYKIPNTTWNSANLVTDLPVLAQTSTITANASDRNAILTVPYSNNYISYNAELYGTTTGVNTQIDYSLNDRVYGFIRTPTQVLSPVATPYENRALITWSPPESNGGETITGYTVTANPGGASVTVGGSTTSAIVSGLTNGESYTFTVAAINAVGAGDIAVTNAVIPTKTVPFAPTNLTATINIDGDIEVRWLPNADNGGHPITSYRVTTVPPTQTIDISGWTGRYAKITGIAAATTYTVNVSAANILGLGPVTSVSVQSISGSSGNTTIVSGDISGVTNLRAGYDVSNNKYIIKWSAPSYPVSDYQLRMNNGPTVSIPTGTTKYEFTGEGGDRVVNIYTSSVHTIYRYASGKLRGSGARNGITSNTTNSNITSFIDVEGIDWTKRKAIDVAVANYTTAMLLDNGDLYVMNNTLSKWTLPPLNGAKIVQMSAGNGCVALLLDSGKVIVRGSNPSGRLGVGVQPNVASEFKDVSGIDWSTQKAASVHIHKFQNMMFIVMTDGSLYISGRTYLNNQILGLTKNTDYIVATPLPQFGTTYLAKEVYTTYDRADITFVLLQNGRVLTGGDNTGNTLGIGERSATITWWEYMSNIDGVNLAVDSIIGTNFWNTILKMRNGDLYYTGNSYNKLPITFTSIAYTPALLFNAKYAPTIISIGPASSYQSLTSSGDVYVLGYNSSGIFGAGIGLNTTVSSLTKTESAVITLPIDISNRLIYGFSLTAVSGTRISTSLFTSDVGDLPLVPTNVSVQSFGSNTLRTAWSSATGATSYNVYANGILKGITSNTIFDISGIETFSNNEISIEASNQYGDNSTDSVFTIMVGGMNGLYYRYNDVSNVYSLLWDNQPKFGPYNVLELNINGNTQLAPSTVYDNYMFNGSTARPIRIQNHYYESMLLMSDGTVKIYSGYGSLYQNIPGSNQGYVTIPGLNNVANCFFYSRYYNVLIFAMRDGSTKMLYNGSITTIPNIRNIYNVVPYSYYYNSYIIDMSGNVYSGSNDPYVFNRVDMYLYNTNNNQMYLNIKSGSRYSDINYGVNQFVVTTDGKLFSRSTYSGGSYYGRPDYNSSSQFYLIQDISNLRVKTVATSTNCSAVVLEDGRVMTCGKESITIGRIAGANTPSDRFNFLIGINNAVDVTCNNDFVLILLSNGRVLGFGINNGGLLSAPTTTFDIVSTPSDIGLSNIIGINTSTNGAYFLHADGRVLVAGSGTSVRFPITNNTAGTYYTPQLAIGTSAAANTLVRGTSYAISSRYYINDALRSSTVSASPAPLQQTDSIDLSVVAAGSAIVRVGSTVVTVPVVSSVADVSSNSAAIINDPRISATPIVAFVAKPATEADLGSSLRTGADTGFSNILVQQTVAGQTVTSIVKPQSAEVVTPLVLTDTTGISASFTTSSAGAGNIVAASVQGVDTSNNYLNVFLKVVNGAGQIQQSGFNVPLEVDLSGAGVTRDTVTIRRFNATSGAFEDVGIMTKKAGTTSIFTYTFTTNSYYTVVPCILGHTKVMTPRGPIAAAFLKVGDNVLTNDGRQVAIKQIYTSAYKTTKETAPYRFKKGCIGGVYPTKDFEVSPTHAVAVPGGWVIPKHAALSGVKAEQVMIGEKVNYFHIELENYLRDNLVLEGGAVVESFGVNWLRGQPKGTVVYTFDHATKLFKRPAYIAKRKVAGGKA